MQLSFQLNTSSRITLNPQASRIPLGTVRGLSDDTHDAPSAHPAADRVSAHSYGNSTATAHNVNVNVNDDSSGAVRRKSIGCNGDSHSAVAADRGLSALQPPRPVLKKSHKKGAGKSEGGMDAGTGTGTGTGTIASTAASVHFNGDAFRINSSQVPGAGAGAAELNSVSKGVGRPGNPSYPPSSSSSSSSSHPQPSLASQRQRRTESTAAGKLLLTFIF